MKSTAIKLFMVLFALFGVVSTAGHYLLPRPDAAMFEQAGLIPPGPEWYLAQLPLYDQNVLMTAMHVIPSMLFMLLILFQLSSRIRQRNIQIHRTLGRVFIGITTIIGLSGLLLGFVMPFGGIVETSAISVITVMFLGALAMGVKRVRQGNIVAHRFWMLNMAAIAFSPLTMRMMLAPSMMLTDFTGPQLFGPTMLISTALNLLILNLYLRAGENAGRFAGRAAQPQL